MTCLPLRFRTAWNPRAFLLGCLVAFTAAPAGAAILLELEGVQGPVTRAGFTGQLTCDSFHFEVDRELSDATKAGTADITLGVGNLGFVTLLKKLDPASALILRKGISGSSIGSATIRIFAEPSKPRAVPYLQISLDVAFIKSSRISGTVGSLPTEEIQIFYNKIVLQNAKTSDGLSPTVAGKAAWDLVQSKPWADSPDLLGFLNSAPVAVTDTVTRKPGVPVKIPVAALLGNDTDPENDALSVTGVTASGAGGATVSLAGGLVYYTPAGNVSDYFNYTLMDEYGATAVGQVNVMLDGVEQKLNLAAAIEHMPAAPDLFRLSFNGIPGLQYRILFAAEVAPEPAWEFLGYVTAADNGLVNYVDASGTSGRIYKVVYP